MISICYASQEQGFLLDHLAKAKTDLNEFFTVLNAQMMVFYGNHSVFCDVY